MSRSAAPTREEVVEAGVPEADADTVMGVYKLIFDKPNGGSGEQMPAPLSDPLVCCTRTRRCSRSRAKIMPVETSTYANAYANTCIHMRMPTGTVTHNTAPTRRC